MTELPHDPPRPKRKFPRFKTGVPLEFKTEGASVASRAETADICLGGCYVEMSFTLQVGTKLDIVLWVEEHRLPIKAVVVTHHPQFGNGIQFLEMTQEDQAKLAHFLEKCEVQEEQKPEAEASGTGN